MNLEYQSLKHTWTHNLQHIFNGLAIALIFGILVSTLRTLIVIPVVYYALRCES